MEINSVRLAILDSQSVINLRNLVTGDPKCSTLTLGALSEKTPLNFVTTEILVDSAITLEVGRGSQLEADLVNSKSIYKALRNLDSATATDERLWVTLALGQYHDYSISRWFSGQQSTLQAKYFHNHVLATGVRDRWRNQSISRLWWVAHYASQLGAEYFDRTIELVYFNSDLGSQLLGKPSISASREIARAIVSVAHYELIENKSSSWDRAKFRDFMKAMDLLTGRRILETLPATQLASEVSSLFKAIFSA
jgi:hypothetical protein